MVFVHFCLEMFALPGRNGCFIENRCRLSMQQRRVVCKLSFNLVFSTIALVVYDSATGKEAEAA